MDPYPYNLPIFRRWHEAASPDGRFVAWMTAAEVSMSNPTSGTLQLSDGLQLAECNPSFIWSDDSRFLAIPQWRSCLGLQHRQRILVLDTLERIVFASGPVAWFAQPQSFAGGVLSVTGEPASAKQKEHTWRIPEELHSFRTLPMKW